MVAGILQLISTGPQDVFLTVEPQINVFKYNYFRYVNFSTDIYEIPLNDQATFNKKTSCDIPIKGHLLSKLFLHLQLPALVKNGGTYLSWSDTLGYSIFDGPIELELGGVIVDRIYPQFLDMYDDLANFGKQNGKNFMLLKSDVYVSSYYNAIKPVDLMIPLDFWFTKKYNMALPLLSMYNQMSLKIHFKLKDFSKVVNYDGLDPLPVNILNSSVFGEYIFLDDQIVDSSGKKLIDNFKTQKHQFLIDQVQFQEDEVIPANASVFNCSLHFDNVCKELIFACVDTNNINSNNYFSYSTLQDLPFIKDASLILDGRKRFDTLPEYYYRAIFPDLVHSTIPMKYIYCMPFCLKPEDNQPTGSLNLSRFTDVSLSLNMHSNNNECHLFVYAISINLVTIENGFVKFEFII